MQNPEPIILELFQSKAIEKKHICFQTNIFRHIQNIYNILGKYRIITEPLKKTIYTDQCSHGVIESEQIEKK